MLQVEGAEKVHIEEARLRFDMAIGKMAPVTEDEILLHLREFAEEVRGAAAPACSSARRLLTTPHTAAAAAATAAAAASAASAAAAVRSSQASET